MADRQINAGEPDTLMRKHGIVQSFGFAWAGLAYLVRTQRNARIELLAGLLACGLGAWLHISPVSWAILAITIAMVLILEGINTAIEAAVDLFTSEWHPLARICKDLAAGMVLVASLAAIVVGVLILGLPLWAKLVR